MNLLQRPPDASWPRTAGDPIAAPPGRGRIPRAVGSSTVDTGSDKIPFEILIVEDDPILPFILKDIIELDGVYRVTDIASNLSEALASIEAHRPGLAMIDVHLGGNATGFEVAARVHEIGVPTLFSTGNPLPFPVPEVALGCLCKPYSSYSVLQSLRIAQQLIRGVPVDHDLPLELELY